MLLECGTDIHYQGKVQIGNIWKIKLWVVYYVWNKKITADA